MDKKIRLLKPEEIDVRVGAIYEKGITLLLYKDARVDMAILDETFGSTNWKRKHIYKDEVMFCEVSIKDEKTGEWVGKTDVGVPSFSEPIKGAASDAFKRACTNWCIGRELYTAPFIWIPMEKVNVATGTNGKKTVKDKYFVQSISYDEELRTIIGLVVCNQKGDVVFQALDTRESERRKLLPSISDVEAAQLMAELNRTGVSKEGVLKKHSLNDLLEMDKTLYNKAMKILADTPDKAA